MNGLILNNFLTVAGQVAVVFCIVALGCLGGKTGLISDETCNGMANVVISYVTPAMILMAFQRSFEAVLLRGFLISLGGMLACTLFSALVSRLLIPREPRERWYILNAAVIFGNLGMMALPLQEALFGSDGVFYGAAGVTGFQLLFWTVGITAISGHKNDRAGLLRGLLNPGLLGTLVGLALFFASLTIPAVPAKVLSSMAALNMPLSMLVIGQRLAKVSFSALFNDRGVWRTAALRLVLVPVVAVFALSALGVTGAVGVCIVLGAACPAAAIINMLAIAYGRDAELAAKTVSMHTALSMLTLPPIILLAYTVLMG